MHTSSQRTRRLWHHPTDLLVRRSAGVTARAAETPVYARDGHLDPLWHLQTWQKCSKARARRRRGCLLLWRWPIDAFPAAAWSPSCCTRPAEQQPSPCSSQPAEFSTGSGVTDPSDETPPFQPSDSPRPSVLASDWPANKRRRRQSKTAPPISALPIWSKSSSGPEERDWWFARTASVRDLLACTATFHAIRQRWRAEVAGRQAVGSVA